MNIIKLLLSFALTMAFVTISVSQCSIKWLANPNLTAYDNITNAVLPKVNTFRNVFITVGKENNFFLKIIKTSKVFKIIKYHIYNARNYNYTTYKQLLLQHSALI